MADYINGQGYTVKNYLSLYISKLYVFFDKNFQLTYLNI